MTPPVPKMTLNIAAVRVAPTWLETAASVVRTTTLAAVALAGGEQGFAQPALTHDLSALQVGAEQGFTAPVVEDAVAAQLTAQLIEEEIQSEAQQEQDILHQQQQEQDETDRYNRAHDQHERDVQRLNDEQLIHQQIEQGQLLQKFLQHRNGAPDQPNLRAPFNTTRPVDPETWIRQAKAARNRAYVPTPAPAPIERRTPVRAPVKRPQAKARSRLKTPMRQVPIQRPSSPPSSVSRPGNRP